MPLLYNGRPVAMVHKYILAAAVRSVLISVDYDIVWIYNSFSMSIDNSMLHFVVVIGDLM